MVRLDVTMLRYLSREEFRVLTAVEMGMKNHELVSAKLITKIAGLKHGGAHKHIATLHKHKLIRHENKVYDGYKLTYLGYDFLALKALVSKGLIKGVGRRIGVGKESDIYEVINDNDEVLILKIHRLGRVCFRAVKTKRDYLVNRKSASFMYLSRLAAVREFAYLKALYDEGFPTPIPYEVNRHCILMSKIDARPMTAVSHIRNPERVFNTLMNLIVQFAQCGLIHGDFNEFNLLLSKDEEITVIDFPQMVSTSHRNAKMLFERDVEGVRAFFSKKLGYDFDQVPQFIEDTGKEIDLDVALKASGAMVSKDEVNDMSELVIASRNQLLEDDDDDDEEGEEEEEEDDDDEDDEDDDEAEEEADEEEEDGEEEAKRPIVQFGRKARNTEKMLEQQREKEEAKVTGKGKSKGKGKKEQESAEDEEAEEAAMAARAEAAAAAGEGDDDNTEEDDELVDEEVPPPPMMMLSAKMSKASLNEEQDDDEDDEDDDDDDEDDEDEDEDEEEDEEMRRRRKNAAVANPSSRKRNNGQKTGVSAEQIRQRVRRSLQVKNFKGGSRGNRNQVKNRDHARAVKECKAFR